MWPGLIVLFVLYVMILPSLSLLIIMTMVTDRTLSAAKQNPFFPRGAFLLRPLCIPTLTVSMSTMNGFTLKTNPNPVRFGFCKGRQSKTLGYYSINYHLFGTDNTDGCRFYLLGADSVGRDLFSRIVYGSRVSLTIGFLGVALTAFLGFLAGGISGYYGGKTDWMIMRFAECFMLVPSFFLMLALRSAFPMKLSSTQVYLLIVAILSLKMAGFPRVIRGMALSISKRDFVTAAKAPAPLISASYFSTSCRRHSLML